MKNSRGFTLVELMLVIAMIAVLSATVVLQIVRTDAKFKLDNAAVTVRTQLQELLGWAQNGKTTNGQLPEGYGAVFYPSLAPGYQYQIYADFDGDHHFTEPDGIAPDDSVIATYHLAQDTQFLVDLVSCRPSPTACDVFAETASNAIYINGVRNGATALTATFQQQKSLQSKTVSLNPVSGQITIL